MKLLATGGARFEPTILSSVEERNNRQKKVLFEKKFTDIATAMSQVVPSPSGASPLNRTPTTQPLRDQCMSREGWRGGGLGIIRWGGLRLYNPVGTELLKAE